MYLVEQQERLSVSATKPISWGRHGTTTAAEYSTIEPTARLRSTAKGIQRTLGSNGTVRSREKIGLRSLLPTISPSLELSIRSLIMLLGTPSVATLFVYSCENYECAVIPGLRDLLHSTKELHTPYDVLAWFLHLPLTWFTWKSLVIYLVWYTIQAVLYAIVPGRIGYGQKTLAGYQLPYKLNGFTCYILSHIAFLAAVHFEVIPISIIADNWAGLFIAANLMGYFLTVFAYIKAHWFPSHPEDRKFSGSFLYDMFMGIEFNPRFGEMWDFKLFHNGRPGIIAWTLIDLSFCFSVKGGGNTTSPSIPALLVLLLHTIYVVDFFWHEDWYLRTIDIAHDHFGFYLAWGDSVWLPFTYTVQLQYIYHNQDKLGNETWWLNIIILVLGLGGYIIFRGSNNQKDIMRRVFSPAQPNTASSPSTPDPVATSNAIASQKLQEKTTIWGKPPTFLIAPYLTADGKSHTSLLVTCGYWGLARHMNYFGDMLMATAMGLATMAVSGGPGMVGWWYTIFLSSLLVHRVRRCDQRCSAKYGKTWDEYRRVVRWRIIPGVY